ncbi:MAG: hypothetical protein SW833_14720, partial [Cyanobacteriota bacterium]|nr:hypothetical protein [Cyanobacteriota bacterium]
GLRRDYKVIGCSSKLGAHLTHPTLWVTVRTKSYEFFLKILPTPNPPYSEGKTVGWVSDSVTHHYL